MGTQRITITLPDTVAERLRKEAKQRRRPVSRLVAEALEQQGQERIRLRMIEGYISTREEGRQLAEEWLPLAVEALPDD